MLRIVNTGEGTDSSHHQFCSSASTAQNIFYHHTLSFFFISFLKEFKTVQCSCLPLFQPVAVLWLVVTIWGDGPPICPVQEDSSHPGIPKDKPEDEFLGLRFHSQHRVAHIPLSCKKTKLSHLSPFFFLLALIPPFSLLRKALFILMGTARTLWPHNCHEGYSVVQTVPVCNDIFLEHANSKRLL